MTNCIMSERSDQSFGCERSEPSRQDRAPRSEAQRSAVQLLVSNITDLVRNPHQVCLSDALHEWVADGDVALDGDRDRQVGRPHAPDVQQPEGVRYAVRVICRI